jgi:hypothetical protein
LLFCLEIERDPHPRSFTAGTPLRASSTCSGITREWWETGDHTVEVAYRITRLSPDQADASRLLELDGGPWGIENRLHHVRDVPRGADAGRVRSRNAPPFLAAARTLVLGRLRPLGFPSIVAATRRFVMHPKEELRLLINPS